MSKPSPSSGSGSCSGIPTNSLVAWLKIDLLILTCFCLLTLDILGSLVAYGDGDGNWA